LLGDKAVDIDEYSSDEEHERDEDKTNALAVAEEQSGDVRFLDSSLVGDNEEFTVSAQNEVHIFWAEADDCSVVDDDVR
jgi:hypothetical protein